jgi:hypothetical protein
MRFGHMEAQKMFFEIGKCLGYQAHKIFTQELPTDGVWLYSCHLPEICDLPIVAMEVPITESPKSIRGSISTLEEVSPLLAIMLINEDEIRRNMVSKGNDPLKVESYLEKKHKLIQTLLSSSKQNFEIWSMNKLRRLYLRFTNKKSIFQKPQKSLKAKEGKNAHYN